MRVIVVVVVVVVIVVVVEVSHLCFVNSTYYTLLLQILKISFDRPISDVRLNQWL